MHAGTAYTIVLTHIFFHPDCNRWSRSFTESADAMSVSETAPGRGLYRQWGISPRPEDISFSCPCLIIHGAKKIATPRFLAN